MTDFELELEVNVQTTELNTLDKDLRLPWPSNGMACDVDGCTSNVFTNYRKYIKHWKEIHTPTIKTYRCVRCGMKHLYRFRLLTHLVKYHKMPKTDAKSELEKCKIQTSDNVKFICPGNILPRKKC